jgi:hypothetical protein
MVKLKNMGRHRSRISTVCQYYDKRSGNKCTRKAEAAFTHLDGRKSQYCFSHLYECRSIQRDAYEPLDGVGFVIR